MASKRFSLTFDVNANIGPVKATLQQFQSLLKNTALNIPVDIKGSMEGTLAKLETEIQSFEKTAAQGFSSMSEIRTAEKSFGRIQFLMSQLSNQALKLGTIDFNKFLPKETQERTKILLDQLKELQKLQSGSSSAKNIAAQNKELQKQRKIITQIQEKQQKKSAAEEARSAPDWKQIEDEYKRIVEAEKKIKRLQSEIEKLPDKPPKSQKALDEYNRKKGLNAERRRQIDELRLMPDENGELRQVESKTYTQYKNRIIGRYKAGIDTVPETSEQLAGQLEETLRKITEIEQRFNSSDSAFNENLSRLRENLSKISGISLNELPTDLEELKQVILNLSAENIEDIQKAILQLTSGASGLNAPLQDAKKGLQDFGKEFETASRAADDAARLKNQLFDFFSISNTIHIFKNTIREAFNTVKELDAVMTETAVVTDFTVGDMWEKLPEYAEQATKLGSSIKSLYEATTLYYQQGLNSEQAMSVGSETMKMARIANMDAADATEAMTAALRGFNMEIDQTSATRVNDVYSELAAITAADTSQIATAMTKTASIAASANMEFETTAAFLAQIIETTQEAPETAGTAMKTIIARFTEVKELFDKGMLTGEDEEGEVIEINKIDAALKSVGISLRDFLLGSKGIDDIFLELASKWDSLDLATQRYIATTAAGSRQQSRFIAMMSDYERTMELVTAANNSAGAGQKQFDKTLESLDSKLQRLSNAWQQFTMNLANSTIIKAGVDFLSGLLETINKLIEAMSGGNGLVASFITLGTVIGALKTGSALLTGKNTFGKFFDRMGFQMKQQTEAEGGPTFRKPFSYQSPESKGLAYGIYSGFGRLIGGKDYKTRTDLKREYEQAQQDYQTKYSQELARYNDPNGIQLGSKYSPEEAAKEASKEEWKRVEETREAWGTAEKKRGSLKKAQVVADGLTLAGGAANVAAVWAEDKGYEKLSDGLSIVGTTAMAAGQGISFMNNVLDISGKGWGDLLPMVTGLGKTLIGLAPAIASVAAVAGLAAVAFQVAWEMSDEGQLADAVKRTEQTAEGAKNASNSYNNLQTSLKNIENQASAIENMTRNTQEWNDAVNQMNQDTMDLISQNEELAEFAFYEDGMLKLDKSKIDEYMHQEELDVIQAKNAELNARILEEQARQKTYGINDFLGFDEGVYDVGKIEYGEQASTRNEDFTKQLAQAVADGKVWNEDSAEKWAEKFGENIEVKLDEDSLKNLREYGNALKESSSKIDIYEAQIANNIKTMAKTEGTLTDFADDLDDSVVAGLRDQAYQQKYNEILETFAGKNIERRVKEYAALMGYTLDGTVYGGYSYNFIDKQGNKQTVDYKTVIQALASEQADEAAVENLSKVEEFFGRDTKVAEALSQDGISMTNESIAQLGQVFGENVQADEGTRKKILAKQLGFDDYEAMSQAAAEQGLSMDDLYETMAENYESAVDRIAKQRTDLISNMSKYTRGGTEESAKMLAILESKFGDEGRNMLESVFSSLERSGDKSIIRAGYGNFMTMALQASKEEVQELSDFISQIDWSNPIEAASKLKSEIKVLNGVTGDFSKNMLSLKTGFLGTASQMRYFIDSADFTDVQEDLEEILQTSEEISAADVLDLADSYQGLNKMLKNTEASAGGVAKALDAIAKKQIRAEDLTDAVMAALQGYDSLGSMIAKLSHDLGNFDPGIDENIATEFVAQAYETLNANLEKGAFGNSQNFKYLDYMFGNNWRTDAEGNALSSDQIAQQMQYYTQALGKNSENMEKAWTNLQAGYNLTGRQKLTSEQKDALGNLQIGRKGGEILLSGYEGMTTQDIVSRIAEGYGVSETFAAMMVADYKNYSKDFRFNMATQEADMNQVAANTLKGMATFGDSMVIDQQSINTIASLWGFNTDDFSSILQNLVSQEGKKLLTANFYDNQGNLKESSEIQKEINRVAGRDEEATYFDEDGAFRYDDFKRDSAALGLSEAQSDQVAQDLIDAQIEASGEPVELKFDADKGIKEVSVDAGEKVSEEVSAGYEQAANESLVTTFFDYFSSNPLPVSVEPRVEGDPIIEEGTVILKTDTSEVTAAVNGLELSTVLKIIPSLDLPGFATGVTNSPISQQALVGEKGPELIERADGTAYLSGINGPEITHIGVGDTVHTAEETSRIFRKNRGYTMPRFEGGTTSHGYGKTSGGKGTGKGKDGVENPFDKLYNLVREIDEELRQRERIERRYEKLLESLNESANQIIRVSREQLNQLEYERKLQEKLIAGRKEQIKLYQQEKEELNKYGWVEQNERGESVLRIDWDKIDAITNKDEMGKVEEYVNQLEEWFDSLKEAEDALWDIEDTIQEIKERGSEEYKDLEEAISDALTEAYQKEIDKLEEVNNSIDETNSSLLDAVQKSIDKMRQDRENERTEEELGEKQRRLLYLQQDTSGANQLEILRLQEELEQGQEDYTDTLIDQKISELQEQNEEASKQREQQITLLQAQLDHYVESGEIWKEVYELMDNGLDKDSGLLRGSRLEEILQNADNFKGLSVIGQMDWWTDMNGMIAQALAYLEVGRQLEDIGVEEGKEVEFKTESGDVIKGTIDAQGNVVDANGYIYDNVFQGADGKYYAGKNIKSQEELKPVEEKPESEVESEENKDQSGSNSSGGGYKYQDSRGKWWKTKAEADAANKKYIEEETAKRQSEYWKNHSDMVSRITKEAAAEKAKKEAASQAYARTPTAQKEAALKAAEEVSKAIIAEAEADYWKRIKEQSQGAGGGGKPIHTKYATGGLADFTGPAWLDGTKARPELVLNARDTQNFIQLKDILGSIMNRGSFSNTSTENNGDITYDIDINVESVDNDYDVEKIANKVKSLINDNARYRNNNAISLRR